jgi:16S rRNA processing protein RimM
VLTGKKIAIRREQRAKLKKNEYYWSDLEGLTVINQHDTVLGKISYLIETGSNDVFVVKGDKEHAIPYLLGDVVISIDLDTRIMRVNWEEL